MYKINLYVLLKTKWNEEKIIVDEKKIREDRQFYKNYVKVMINL